MPYPRNVGEDASFNYGRGLLRRDEDQGVGKHDDIVLFRWAGKEVIARIQLVKR